MSAHDSQPLLGRKALILLASTLGLLTALGLAGVLVALYYLRGLWMPPGAGSAPPTQQPLPRALESAPLDLPAPTGVTVPAFPSRLERLSFTPVRSFDGHTGGVFGAALSPDNRRLLSGSLDTTVRLWDVETGKELRRLTGHTGAVRAVAFAPDGRRAVSAGDDGSIRLWDLDKGQPVRDLKGHQGPVHAVALTSDGRRLLSGGQDRSLRLWDVQTGAPLAEFYGHDDAVLSLALATDGKHALTGSRDGGVLRWDLETGRELCYAYVGKPVYFVGFLSDDRRALTGGTLVNCLWDMTTGERWTGPSGTALEFHAAAVLPGSKIWLYGTVDGRLEGSSIPNRPETFTDSHAALSWWPRLGSVQAHNGRIDCVLPFADGRRVITAGADKTIKLWSVVLQP